MKNFIFIITIIAMFWSCTSKDDLYKGNFEGKEYRFKGVVKNQIFNKAYSQTLTISGISATLHIDANNTSPGYPYSFDMYKEVPYAIIDSGSYQYNNSYEDKSKHFAVLYIRPDKFSKGDFEKFVAFFQTEWEKIKENVPLNQGYRNLTIVALVYGKDKQFEKKYINKEEAKVKSIIIQTDGQLLYSESPNSIQSTNLSNKIQMPGEKIKVISGGQYTLDALRMFRSEKDRPLELDFELEVE